MCLLKCRSGELVGCGIKFRIQQVPSQHTFDRPDYPKNKKYLKKHDDMSIQPLWLTYFIEILLVLEFQFTKTYFGTFSYKAHFRPQISSNVASKRPVSLKLFIVSLNTTI